MSVQIERRRAERRQADPDAEEELSPEYLALLEVCGGEIRASAEAAPDADKKDAAQAALPSADRRRAGTT